MKILIIVPCYNEEVSSRNVVEEIRAALPEADVLVVNDGSTDETAEAVSETGAMVVTLPYNMGIGAAMQTGYRYADRRDYDVAVQVDGDGQHDPAESSKILDPIERGEADIVVGSRFLGEGDFESTSLRRLGIGIFSKILLVLTRTTVTDATSGFRAVNREAIKLFARMYPEDYPEVESLYLAHLAGLRVREAPVSMRPRAGGKSSITPVRSVYYMVKVILVLFVWLLRRKPELEVGNNGN